MENISVFLGRDMQEFNSSFFNNVNITVTDGGYFNLKPDGEWKQKPHVYQQNKFYYIVDGSCFIMVNGTEYLAKKGDWFFIPSGTLHSYRNISGTFMKKYWMHLEISPKLSFSKHANFPCVININNKKTTALFKDFAKKFTTTSPCDILSVKAIAFSLLSEYLTLSGVLDFASYPKQNTALKLATKYVDEHLNEPITINDLANVCHLHPTHFIRFFKSKMGQTPQSYVNYKRMELAKKLITETDLSISDIAEKTGFYDSMYFSKCFKKYYSVSPRTYRKTVKTIY